MAQLSMNDARCEALFASALQRSDAPTSDVVANAISGSLRELGVRGCTSRMAEEFGEHPNEARDRMRWARQLVSELYASSAPRATGYARAA